MLPVKKFVIGLCVLAWLSPAICAAEEDELDPAQMPALMKSIKEAADTLGTTIDGFNTALSETIKDADQASSLLKDMELSVENRLKQLEKGSDFDKLTITYMELLQKGKDRTLEKFHATQDLDYKKYADRYEDLVTETKRVREDIENERVENTLLLDKIKARRDKIVEEIMLGMFDEATEKLKGVLRELQAMRGKLTQMVSNVETMQPQIPKL